MKSILCFSLLCLTLVSQGILASTLKSTVDRHQIGEDETVNLMITLDDASFSGNPDLAGLDNDFQVVNSSSSSSTQIINGSITSEKEWRYTLLPKKTGKLIIPSFKMKGAFSDAIEIDVLSHAAAQQNNKDDKNSSDHGDLFLEESIDKKEAYVQERMTLTLKIFTAIEIARPEIPDPSLADFMLEKLGQSEYQSKQNGRSYYVLEYKYALFANKSGKVTLPKQRFEVHQIISSAPRSMFDIPGFNSPRTQERILSTPEITLNIKPQPDNLPAPYWLPSEDVTITDNWPEQQRVDVGTPLTRAIEIKALGSMAAHIPPLTIETIAGLKSYAEQPTLDNSRSGDNVLASRKENIAIVPTAAGTYILPAIHVHWYDTKSKQFRTSSIPERTLSVTAAANASTPMQTPTIQPQANLSSNDSSSMNGTLTTVAPSAPMPFYLNVYLWIGATIFFLLLWIVTLILLLNRRNKIGADESNFSVSDLARQQSLKNAFKQLKAACATNDAKLSREALILWAQLQWPDANILTLADVKNCINNYSFAKLADELDSTLYRAAAFWDGKNMLEFLQNMKLHTLTEKKDATLPKLYS